MAKLKIYEKPTSGISKKAMYCWWFANLFNIINQVRKLVGIKKQARYYKRLIKDAPEKKDSFNDKFAQLKTSKSKAVRGLMKSCADFLTASKGTGEFILPFESRELILDRHCWKIGYYFQ